MTSQKMFHRHQKVRRTNIFAYPQTFWHPVTPNTFGSVNTVLDFGHTQTQNMQFCGVSSRHTRKLMMVTKGIFGCRNVIIARENALSGHIFAQDALPIKLRNVRVIIFAVSNFGNMWDLTSMLPIFHLTPLKKVLLS